jgi:transposase-like protein
LFDMSRDRVTVAEAARRLGVTQAAIRKRIERGTIEFDKDPEGLTYVHLDRDVKVNMSHDTLVESLRERIADQQDQIAHLRKQLDESNEANRENRRIIAALTQRIPELPPPDMREQPESADGTAERVNPSPPEEPREETRQRPWYQRWFGG